MHTKGAARRQRRTRPVRHRSRRSRAGRPRTASRRRRRSRAGRPRPASRRWRYGSVDGSVDDDASSYGSNSEVGEFNSNVLPTPIPLFRQFHPIAVCRNGIPSASIPYKVFYSSITSTPQRMIFIGDAYDVGYGIGEYSSHWCLRIHVGSTGESVRMAGWVMLHETQKLFVPRSGHYKPNEDEYETFANNLGATKLHATLEEKSGIKKKMYGGFDDLPIYILPETPQSSTCTLNWIGAEYTDYDVSHQR